MGATILLLSAIYLWACFVRGQSYICDENAVNCETSLDIRHFVTMLHPNEGALYAENGELYRFDVNDTSTANPISTNGIIIADGWERQQIVIVANNSMPGPDIIVYEGQILTVHVHNNLPAESVTLHWHGMYQKGTPYMDGTAMVTQCPILPGQTFSYSFKATPKGTHWYHSLVGTQRVKGLFGALIVKDRQQENMEEHILKIQEWNHDLESDMFLLGALYGLFANRQVIESVKRSSGYRAYVFYAQSALINGKGRFKDKETQKYIEAPLETFSVTSGETYRFRVIGATAGNAFEISVDNHQLKVIATDGNDVTPVMVDSLIVHPGERFDFILSTDQPVSNYWIRGFSVDDDKDVPALAVLQYHNAPNGDPSSSSKTCTQSDTCIVLNCNLPTIPQRQNARCISIEELRAPTGDDPAPVVERDKFKEFFFDTVLPGASLNGIVFKNPPVSALSQPSEVDTQCLDQVCYTTSDDCECTHVLDINNGDTVQLVLINMGQRSDNPMHLHGHSFYVLKVGYPPDYDQITGRVTVNSPDIKCFDSHCNNATWSNPSWTNGNIPDLELKKPILKDTIRVPNGGYVVVRFKADNPGLWQLHCHDITHRARGLSLVFNESFSDWPRVPVGFPVCNNFPRVNPPTPPSSGRDNEQIEKSSFWTVLGVLLAAVVIQLLVILVLVDMLKGQRLKTKAFMVKGWFKMNSKSENGIISN